MWRIASPGLFLFACGSVGDSGKHDAAIDTKVYSDAPIDGATCATNPANLRARWRAEMSPADELGNYGATGIGAISYTPGRHGNAFLIGGANALSINDADMLWPASSFSVEAWVKTTGTGYVVEKYQCMGYCPNVNALYYLYVGGAGQATFGLRTDVAAVATEVADPQHDVADGTWHHLVGVRDSSAGTTAIFVDGVLGVSTSLASDQLGAMTNTDGETDPVLVGCNVTGGTTTYGGFLPGAIDEISYYDGALTATEIAAIYNAPDGECIAH